MRSVLLILLTVFFVMAVGIFFSGFAQAQYYNPWSARIFPLYPWFYANPFPLYPVGYFGLPVLPPLAASPYLVEPSLRFANAPVTLTIPTVSTTTPPLTAIINLLDPTVFASNVAVLTTNFPLVFDLLVTTFQLPLI
ncbi:MAG: hypothetical protein ACMUIM_05440 [bacterium]